MLRFRCRLGHACTAQSFLSGQAEARETLLSTLFGCLIEEATSLKRIAKAPRAFDDTILALELDTRAQSLEREAEDVCKPEQREDGKPASPGVYRVTRPPQFCLL
jgi:two-component system, chemotaxis family, protein-glutamate methylesterase/glutaminase